MKNKLLTLVAILAVIGLLGKFYAVPAVAQAVEAALVQYRDSPPRQPFTIRGTFAPSPIEKIQPISFPAVPAGKRMIVTSVAGTVNIVLPSTEMCIMAMTTNTGFESYQLLPLTSNFASKGVNTYSGTTALHLPLDPGDTGTVGFTSVQPFQSATVIFTGYFIDVP